MRSPKSIKLKAAFLLTVFTFNILVSFACSVGIKMGFNNSHHIDERKKKSHSHSHKHAHGEASKGKHSHGGHSHATAHKHSNDLATGDQKDHGQKDCCNEKSVELQKHDKSANHSSNPVIKVPVLVPFLAAFSGLEMKAELSPVLHKLFIPQYYPPPDKRVIIQSFQI